MHKIFWKIREFDEFGSKQQKNRDSHFADLPQNFGKLKSFETIILYIFCKRAHLKKVCLCECLHNLQFSRLFPACAQIHLCWLIDLLVLIALWSNLFLEILSLFIGQCIELCLHTDTRAYKNTIKLFKCLELTEIFLFIYSVDRDSMLRSIIIHRVIVIKVSWVSVCLCKVYVFWMFCLFFTIFSVTFQSAHFTSIKLQI